MIIAALQYDIAWENPQANYTKIKSILQNSDVDGVDILVLPEMFNTGFSMDSKRIAETYDGPSVSFLKYVAQEYSLLVIATMATLVEGKYYNRCIGISPQGQEFFYDKKHLFSHAGEHIGYNKGKTRTTTDYKGWRICPLICYDLRFPTWSYNDDNIDLYIYMANWPTPRVRHWSQLLLARAIENQSYVLGVNRIGNDGSSLSYCGQSAIIDFNGTYLEQANNHEGLMKANLDYDNLNDFRKKLPFLKDQ